MQYERRNRDELKEYLRISIALITASEQCDEWKVAEYSELAFAQRSGTELLCILAGNLSKLVKQIAYVITEKRAVKICHRIFRNYFNWTSHYQRDL
jgi:hypothetical protein